MINMLITLSLLAIKWPLVLLFCLLRYQCWPLTNMLARLFAPSANKGLKPFPYRMISRVSFSFKQVTRFMILALFVNHSVQNEYF